MRSYIFTLLTIADFAVSAALPGKSHGCYGDDGPSSAIIPLTATEFSAFFNVELEFANQTFSFLLDTGSSDTWVKQTGFQCFNVSTNLVTSLTSCNFANTSYNISPTFHEIPDENFGVTYGAGSDSGLLGYEDVTIGGIQVKNQTVGIVNKSTDVGDGESSGTFGMAYPGFTSAHPGQSIPNDTFRFDKIIYEPLLFTMASRGLIEPFFGISLQRTPRGTKTGPGGYLTLGAIPPVYHSQEWATVPVELTNHITPNVTGGVTQLSFWSATVDNVVYGCSNVTNVTSSEPFQGMFDSGNPTIALPYDLPTSINALFVPPAIQPAIISDPWYVDCNATAPEFAITISGQSFWVNRQDMVIELGEGLCQSAVISSDVGGTFFTNIGAAFLKNVVAVFDFGVNEMRFAAN